MVIDYSCHILMLNPQNSQSHAKAGLSLNFLNDLKLLHDQLHTAYKSVTVSMGKTLSKLLGMINSSFFNNK